MACVSSSSHLPTNSGVKLDNPVTLPPGRARLMTSPSVTGSPTVGKTMGMRPVACLAARAASVPEATMTSTLSATSSAATAGSRSNFPSASRYSITTFRFSTHQDHAVPDGRPLPGGARRRGWGARSLFEGRSQLTAPRRRAARRGGRRPKCRGTPAASLLDHLIRPQEERLRDRQSEGLGGLEVDDELELGGLLYREVAGLRPLQNLVHVCRSAPIDVSPKWSIGHEAALIDKQPHGVHGREPVPRCQVHE